MLTAFLIHIVFGMLFVMYETRNQELVDEFNDEIEEDFSIRFFNPQFTKLFIILFSFVLWPYLWYQMHINKS